MLYHLRHDHHPSHAPITPFRSPFLATHPPSNPHPTLPSTHLTPHVLPRHHRLVLRDVPVLDQLHVREKHRYACNSLLLSISSPVWLALLHCSLLLSVCLASLLHSLPALMSRFMHCMNSHPSSTPHHSPTSHPHTHPHTHTHTHTHTPWLCGNSGQRERHRGRLGQPGGRHHADVHGRGHIPPVPGTLDPCHITLWHGPCRALSCSALHTPSRHPLH